MLKLCMVFHYSPESHNRLMTVDTIGYCLRPIFTVGVSQHMLKITHLWKFELNRSMKLRDINEKKKKQGVVSQRVVCFQMLDFETSSSKSEVSKSNSWKFAPFSKTMLLQRMPFLTMFYTINLSPLLVIKKGFMLIIILSYNQ